MTAARSTMAHGSKRDAGFTLIEMLVALTLLAMVLAIVPGALRTGKRALAVAAAAEQDSETALALSFIAERMNEAMPIYDRGEGNQIRIAFSGTSDSVRFVAPMPNGPFGGGIYRIELASREGSEASRRRLVLAAALFGQQKGGTLSETQERDLVPDLETLRFRYFGGLARDDERAWRDDWVAAERLPELVEISLEARQHVMSVSTPVRVALKLRPPS